jgi:hypothetical protein
MKLSQKEKAEKRARYFFALSISRIVAEITIILGFFIVIYLIVRKYV